jgi:two-component sensor histidine kinase
MKRRNTPSIILCCVLMGFTVPLFSQKAQSNAVDSLIVLTGKLLDIQLDSAEQKARLALSLAVQQKLRKQQLIATERLGMVELRRGNYEAAKAFLDQVEQACSQSPCDADVMALLHSSLGGYYFRTGDALSAGDNFLKSAKYYEQSSTPERAQGVLINSATVLINTDWKEKAFTIFTDFVKDPKSDTLYIYKAYNNMAMIRASQQNFKEAISLFKKSIAIMDRAGIEDNSIRYNLALVYEDDGRFTEALAMYKQLAEGYTQSGEQRMLLKVHQGMANTYAALKNNVKALEYLKLAEQALDTATQHMEYMDMLSMKHRLYANLGNYREAYRYYGEFQRESMAAELKESQLQYLELQTQYERAQQELAIEIQEKTIANQRLVLSGSLVLVFILLAFGVYIFHASRQKDKLNTFLREKNEQVELLHRELRHRIGNNLAFITSLMQIQSRRLSNPEALEVLFDSESRVRAMSLLHRKLNSVDGDYTRISLKNYLEEILMNLRQSYPFERQAPEISLHIDEVNIDAESAMRIGLIINELITNAYKHAFPGDRTGIIAIRVERGDQDKLSLTYRDDGVGLPQHIDLDSSDRMGMILIRSLANLLNSQPKFRTDNGTIFEMEIAA